MICSYYVREVGGHCNFQHEFSGIACVLLEMYIIHAYTHTHTHTHTHTCTQQSDTADRLTSRQYVRTTWKACSLSAIIDNIISVPLKRQSNYADQRLRLFRGGLICLSHTSDYCTIIVQSFLMILLLLQQCIVALELYVLNLRSSST